MPDAPIKDHDLNAAIGEVAQASAWLDDYLRSKICDLAGLGDHSWFMVHGQTTSWLIETVRVVLRERLELEAAHTLALAETKQLQELRNAVIHGIWQPERLLEGSGVTPRPWVDKTTTPETYSCLTSRPSRPDVFQERVLTVGDVRELACRIDMNRKRLGELLGG